MHLKSKLFFFLTLTHQQFLTLQESSHAIKKAWYSLCNRQCVMLWWWCGIKKAIQLVLIAVLFLRIQVTCYLEHSMTYKFRKANFSILSPNIWKCWFKCLGNLRDQCEVQSVMKHNCTWRSVNIELYVIFKKIFYLFQRERERMGIEEGQRERER